MPLNHVNLAVSDVLQTQQFLQTYFGFQPLAKGSPVLTVLQDENGLVLTLSNFSKAAEVSYPQSFISDSFNALKKMSTRSISD